MKSYAGIGSRETPEDFCSLFFSVGKFLATKGFILRSGHAEGADISFENGCDSVNGEKEIWLPWKKFGQSDSDLIVNSPEAFALAEKFHPAWVRLSHGAKKLQARNCHQVLGKDLKSPCDFVLCWTANGSGKGGTGQAIRIAKEYNIRILDLGKATTAIDAKNTLIEFFKTIEL